MNPDFAEILSELSAAGTEFIIVGAFAVAAHGNPRATGLDVAHRVLDSAACATGVLELEALRGWSR